MFKIRLVFSLYLYSTEFSIPFQSVSHNVEHLYIDSSCHTLLAQRDKIVRPNPRIVEVVTVSVAIVMIRHGRYDSVKKVDELRISDFEGRQRTDAPGPLKTILIYTKVSNHWL